MKNFGRTLKKNRKNVKHEYFIVFFKAFFWKTCWVENIADLAGRLVTYLCTKLLVHK